MKEKPIFLNIMAGNSIPKIQLKIVYIYLWIMSSIYFGSFLLLLTSSSAFPRTVTFSVSCISMPGAGRSSPLPPHNHLRVKNPMITALCDLHECVGAWRYMYMYRRWSEMIPSLKSVYPWNGKQGGEDRWPRTGLTYTSSSQLRGFSSL